MLDWLEQAVSEPANVPLPVMATRMAVAFGLGCIAAVVHSFSTHWNGRKIDRAFMTTLILLALLIALVTQVIGNNAARAFSLVGTLAIVRFRTVVEDTRDTAFVIYSVVSGMAAGSGYLLGPLLCTPLVLFTVFALRTRQEDRTPHQGTLILRMAAGRSLDGRVEGLLKQFAGSFRLVGVSTARGGSAMDMTYSLPVPAPALVLDMLAELSRIEGIQGVEFKES